MSGHEIEPFEVDLHDAKMAGIIMHAGDLELRCYSIDRVLYTVRFTEVARMCANNFREGNIIFELLIYKHDIPVELIRQAYGESDTGEPPWLVTISQEASSGGWTLLQVTSSYGCELVALGRGVITFLRG